MTKREFPFFWFVKVGSIPFLGLGWRHFQKKIVFLETKYSRGSGIEDKFRRKNLLGKLRAWRMPGERKVEGIVNSKGSFVNRAGEGEVDSL